VTRGRLTILVCLAVSLACTGAALVAAGPAAASAADVTPPVTTCDAPASWQRASFIVSFSSSDADSGVAAIWAALDGAEPQQVGGADGGSVEIAVPAGGAFDGVHTLGFYATDVAGNAEPAHSVQLRIDTTGPAVAVRPAYGWQGRTVQLSYRVRDALSPAASVRITVSDAAGTTVATLEAGEQTTGAWRTAAWRPRAAGTYSVTAAAADLAGNAAASAAAEVRVTALRRFVAGRSVRGRAIGVTRFGAGPRRMLVLGGVHGDEYGTPVARALERYLLAHPRALPAGARLDVLACGNPDGYAARTRANARRVDLNRNLPTRNWRRRLRARDASSLLGLTGGRSPGSEPETKAVLTLLATRYDAVVSLHSRAGILDCSGPGARALGRRMSRLCGLPLGRLWYDPYITGSLGRYVPERYDIPIVTVELRRARLDAGLRAALLEPAR
jgi:protein MpaA